MFSNETLQLIAMGGTTVGVIGAVIGAFPYLKNKGIDISKLLDTANTALTAAGPAIDAVKGLLPANPAINLIDFIDKEAVKAVKGAQQLNDSSQLTSDARKQTAQNSVYAALKEIGIDPSDDQKKLIDDAIEAAVYDLPHAPADVKQLQTTIDQQTSQNQQLQNENTQLKQTIQTITQVVQPITATTNTETPADQTA